VLNFHDVSERQPINADWSPQQIDAELLDRKLH
jgi:hypothetical protein